MDSPGLRVRSTLGGIERHCACGPIERLSDKPAVVASQIAAALFLGVLVALPAAVDPTGVLAFAPIKSSLLQIVGFAIGVAWLLGRVRGRRPAFADVWARPVVRCAVAAVAASAVSTALSPVPAVSFFGSFDRGTGWLTLAASAVLFAVAADVCTDERRRERATQMLVLGSLIPCGYAILQSGGYDPIRWTPVAGPGSTLGSPTFLAGYLVLVLPFALYRALSAFAAATSAGKIGLVVGRSAVLVVIVGVLAHANIRGALLGALAASATFVALARSAPRATARPPLARTAIGLVVGLVLIATILGSGGGEGLRRFLLVGQPTDSAVGRITVWGDALALGAGTPKSAMLGFGPETQALIFERAEATVRQTQDQQWDRAHNLLLDTWLTGGLLGVVTLGSVVATAVYSALTARPVGLLTAAIVGALIGHVVEASFAFESVVTTALFWVVLGLAAAVPPPQTPRDFFRAWPRQSRRRRTWLAIGAVCSGGLLVGMLARPAIADWQYGRARRLAAAGDLAGAAEIEEQAAVWVPWVVELPTVAGLDWNLLDVSDRAESDLREAARREPAEPMPALRLADLYLAEGRLDDAERACGQALANGPFRASAWDTCADVSVQRKELEVARARRARATDLRRPP
jgi:hypothetical protein